MARVSIVTPCYNAARFVGDTIESVRRQTFEDWEYVIVDDGSTDDSRSIIEPFVQDPRIRLFSQSRGGVASARNYGFAHTSAHTDYLLFLDADDTLHERMLETMVNHLDRHPEAGLANCGFVWLDEDGQEDTRRASSERLAPGFPLVRQLPEDEIVTPFSVIYAAGGLVPTMSTVFRRAAYEKTGGFDETFGQGYEDSDVVLRLALSSDVHFVKERLYRYRRRPGQHSGDMERLHIQREKLFAKLRSLGELTPRERARLRYAEDFRTGPYAAFHMLRQCRGLWRQRRWLDASKRLARALLRLTSSVSRRLRLADHRGAG